MFQFFESPAFVFLFFIVSCVFLFVLFLKMCSGKNGEHQIRADMSTAVARERRSECEMVGFLEKLPKGDPLPDECISCPNLVECALAKRAFDWYIGQKSTPDSEDEGTNRMETPRHFQ